jgi:Tol biopolymer transport system component
MVARTVGHYRTLRALGHGGMGDVYLAEDTRLKRLVALKFLPDDVAADAVRLERFEREAQVLAALSHPNIVTIYAIEHDDGDRFIAMEFLEGSTLAEIIPRDGLPLGRLLSLATQIVDAVVAAHGHKIVLPGDRAKVLDFGLAKLRDGPEAATLPTQDATGEGRIVGTVAYMSPEQAEGRTVDERSDIFSLGVMLYEMATGQRPFNGDTSLSVLSAILRDSPRPIGELNSGLPRDVWRIVRHCLAKDPDKRYQSAKDLRHDLDDLAQSLSSGELAAPPTTAPPANRWPARAAAAVVLVGALAWMAAWRDRGHAPEATPPALTHEQLTQREGAERSPSVSPDGKWVVYVADGDIFLQSVTGQTAINLTGNSPSVEFTPAFSPDGETIAFRSTRDGGGIFVMGRTGESVRRLTSDGFNPAWFPDGRTIVYASGEGTVGPENRVAFSELWVVAASGGDPRRLFEGDAVQPRVSPGGRRIAFWAVPADAATRRLASKGEPANRDLWTINIDGTDPVRAAAHDANEWNPVWSPDGRWLYFLSNRSGGMGLWRVAIDESTGVTQSDPQPLVTPAWYVADFGLSADGSVAVYTSLNVTNNLARVRLDPASATVRGDVVPVTTGTNDYAWADVSADGRYAALTTSSRTREDLYLLTLADGTMRRLTDDFARDRWPRFSPDGRTIYFYSDRRGYQIWQINVDGSRLRQLTNHPELSLMYPSPSPDGTRLAAADQDIRMIALFDTRDFGTPVHVAKVEIEPPTGALQTHGWSPDGRSLLVSAVGPFGQSPGIWSYTPATGATKRLADCAAPTWMKDGRRIVCVRAGVAAVADVVSGAIRDLPLGPVQAGSLRLVVGESQLFFLQNRVAADIWVARFEQQTR